MFADTATLKKWLRESYSGNEESRDLAQKTIDYYYGDQLDSETMQIVIDRDQPVQWENNLAKMGEKILAFRQNHRGEIKMLGRQRQDAEGARLLTDVLRFIAQQTDYDALSDESDEDLMIAGCAAHEVMIEEDPTETDRYGRTAKDVKIRKIPYMSLGLDPYATASDYSDARYVHQFYWVDREDLKKQFPKAKIDEIRNTNFTGEIENDEDLEAEGQRDRVPLVYTWYRLYDEKEDRDRYYYAFWSDDVVLQQGESPYDFDGFPVVVEYVYRKKNNRENLHFGLFRNIIPLQDAINFAKLRLTNMLGTNKILVEKDAVDDVWEFAEEYSKDDSIVEVNDINRIKEIRQNADVQQLISTIMDNRQQIKEIIGANDEFLAMANNRLSGEAISKRLDIGSMGISRFIKASMRLQKRTFEIAAKMVQQYYDSERVMQIVEPDDAVRYFTINETAVDENGFPVLQIDEGIARPVVKTDFRMGKYDLIFVHSTKPPSPSAERLRQSTELLKVLQVTDPDLVKYLVPEILRDMQSPAADMIRQVIMQREQQKQQQGQDPTQVAALQAKLAEAQAKIAKMQSEAQLNVARAKSLETKASLDLAGLWSKTAIEKEKNAARIAGAIERSAGRRF